MKTPEFEPQLVALHASLPPHLRDALDLANIRRSRKKKARGNPAAKSRTLKKTVAGRDRAVDRYAASPHLQIVNALLHLLVERANVALPQAFRTVPVNLFGKAGNRLDPLDFNGQATARAKGEVCLPQACVRIIVNICTPSVCADGGAAAGLRELNGLSSVRLSRLAVRDTMGPDNGVLKVSALLDISFGTLGASAFAEAFGGLAGINLPLGASASAQIADVSARSKVVFTVDLRQPKLTSIQLNDFTLRHGAVSIHISGLGAFNFLVGPLVTGLKSSVQLFFDVDGAISNALRNVLQAQLTQLLA